MTAHELDMQIIATISQAQHLSETPLDDRRNRDELRRALESALDTLEQRQAFDVP